MGLITQVREALRSLGLEAGLAKAEVDQRLRLGLRMGDLGQRVLAFFLVEIETRRLHDLAGLRSTVLYAEAKFGLDRRRTGELLRAGRALLELPSIDQAFCEQRLTWSKVLELMKVVSPEHEREWLQRAIDLPYVDLKKAVGSSTPGGPPRDDHKGTANVRFPFRAILRAEAHETVEKARAKLSGEIGEPATSAELLETACHLFLQLQEDGTVEGRKRVAASNYRVVLRVDEEDDDGTQGDGVEVGPEGTCASHPSTAPGNGRGASATRPDLETKGTPAPSADAETGPNARAGHESDVHDDDTRGRDTPTGESRGGDDPEEGVRTSDGAASAKGAAAAPATASPAAGAATNGRARAERAGEAAARGQTAKNGKHGKQRKDGAGREPRGKVSLLVDSHELGLLVIDDEDGRAVDRVTSECILCDAGLGIDGKTPDWLREEVLARDAWRCRCCGSQAIPHVHHIVYRSHGGPTRKWNLLVLCRRCHSLVHADLLVLEGKHAKEICFLDRYGGPLHETEQPVPKELLLTLDRAPGAVEAFGAFAPGAASPSLDELPSVVDGTWWRRHAPLVKFHPDRGLELLPGVPLDLDALPPLPAPPLLPEGPDAPLSDFVGRERVVRLLRREVEASRAAGRAFPHTLFTGPPGTGKTTLAHGVAATLGSRLHEMAGSLLKDPATMVRLLANLSPGDVLFLDEVHAVPRAVLEVLYEALTHRRLTLTLHRGARERTNRLELPAFTFLAATTEDADVPDALWSRFGIVERLGFYEPEDLARVVAAKAADRAIGLETDAAALLARHARGTPREAVRLLERVLADVAAGAAAEATEGASGTDTDGAPDAAPDVRRNGAAGDGTDEVPHATAEGARADEHGDAADGGREAAGDGGAEGAAERGGWPLVRRADVLRTLERLGYDEEGLDPLERGYVGILRASVEPVSLARIARLLGTSPEMLERRVEPVLFRRGLIEVTSHGRRPARPAGPGARGNGRLAAGEAGGGGAGGPEGNGRAAGPPDALSSRSPHFQPPEGRRNSGTPPGA